MEVGHFSSGAVGEDFGVGEVVGAGLEVELSAFQDDAGRDCDTFMLLLG